MRNLLLYGCVLGSVLFVALAMHPHQVSATQRDCGLESGRDCGQAPQSMTPTPNGVARAIAVVDVRVNPVARATARVEAGAIPTVMVAITPTPMARTQAKVIGRAMIVPPASVTSLPSVTIPPVTTTPVPVTVDNWARLRLIVKTALLHRKETEEIRQLPPEALRFDWEPEV
jgi:hypothetical protein